ncbi:type II toxin-antitoxin system VapC family toxin [Limnohabitans sp.]|uniref:type II toxin-antitoxin system VapC family toxin n=1 Tax=Limnohabitans sp. TaxID=1907725 RepID=UPI00333F4AA0
MKGVLVDTSVWVAHFRQRNDVLANLLDLDLVMVHPLILGELACGTPPNRLQTLGDLGSLQQVQQASVREVIDFIERERLFGLGCGLFDLQLLASTLLTQGVALWSMDKRLCTLAERFGVMHQPITH